MVTPVYSDIILYSYFMDNRSFFLSQDKKIGKKLKKNKMLANLRILVKLPFRSLLRHFVFTKRYLYALRKLNQLVFFYEVQKTSILPLGFVCSIEVKRKVFFSNTRLESPETSAVVPTDLFSKYVFELSFLPFFFFLHKNLKLSFSFFKDYKSNNLYSKLVGFQLTSIRGFTIVVDILIFLRSFLLGFPYEDIRSRVIIPKFRKLISFFTKTAKYQKVGSMTLKFTLNFKKALKGLSNPLFILFFDNYFIYKLYFHISFTSPSFFSNYKYLKFYRLPIIKI